MRKVYLLGLLSLTIARLVGNCGLSQRVPPLGVAWCPVLLVWLLTVADCAPVHSNRCWSTGQWSHTMCWGCWCPYGAIRPVLKHKPRSLACVWVSGWSKPVGAIKVKAALADEVRSPSFLERPHHRPTYSTLRKVWVRAYLLGPERWWTMPE